jgi:hypothetical protein
MEKNAKTILIVLAVLASAVFGAYKLYSKSQNSNPAEVLKAKAEQEIKHFSINGEVVSEDDSKKRPIAVMVENHPDSRPQSGLSEADVVYETMAEGGITRFMALYQSKNSQSMGPIRSAREYFAQLAEEWGAIYTHVGGSNEVIVQIQNGMYKNISDLNEYYNEQFFTRIKSRPAPHNVYTSTEQILKGAEYHNYSKEANFTPWQFKDELPAATTIASSIEIDFSRVGYEVGWNYDASSNSYKRLLYFEPHVDKVNNEQITAKTVVVQFVTVTPIPRDPLLSVDIDLASGGKALVFQDGEVIEGTWRKEAGPSTSLGTGRTRFYDALQNEIKFNRGKMWLELVPKEKEANLTWQ